MLTVPRYMTVGDEMRIFLSVAVMLLCNVAAHTEDLLTLGGVDWSMTKEEQQWLLTVKGYNCSLARCYKTEDSSSSIKWYGGDVIEFSCDVFKTCNLNISELAERLSQEFDVWSIVPEIGEKYTVQVTQSSQEFVGGDWNCRGIVGYRTIGGNDTAPLWGRTMCPYNWETRTRQVAEDRYTSVIRYEGEAGDLLFVSAREEESTNLAIRLLKHRCCSQNSVFQ